MLKIQLVTAYRNVKRPTDAAEFGNYDSVPITSTDESNRFGSTDSPAAPGDVLRRRVTSGGQTFESESGSGRR